MIHNEAEYKIVQKRLRLARKQLAAYEARLKEENLSNEELKSALDPVRCQYLNLVEEVELYDAIRRGKLEEVELDALGRTLIAVRIWKGVSERELAERLGITESQVIRDERDEYYGITLDAANRILAVLGVQLRPDEGTEGDPPITHWHAESANR